MIGESINQYKVLEKLGSGGMGEVYLAEDTKLNRKVALKFLPIHFSSDNTLKTRFISEARAAARLNHPNIITIFEVNEYDDRPFFAMELVEGKPLSDIIPADGIPPDQAIDIILQICEGLRAAHRAGIVHRDIKPPNILIDESNRCRILDFGLAAVQSEERLTKTGSLLGTVEYMSPEQVRGEKVDHRSDIFSLGVLLYEMLTGQLPFKGDYVAGVVYSVINEIPEMLDRHRSDISAEFQKIIDGALEKDPEIRYQQIDDLISDLRKCRSGQVLERPSKHYPSIAVLPFRDMSEQKDQEYLCDGVAEDIINALTHLEGLRVVARTSAFSYRGRDIDIREIGRKLNVQSLLEGSIRKTGDRLRITAQLINVSDGYHIWSERYDRRLEDVFAIQDEISMAIVNSLQVRLLGNEKEKLIKRYTENIQAYTLYLIGRYNWNKRTEDGIKEAFEYYNRAIETDPLYAIAYTGISDSYNMLGYTGLLTPGVAFVKAKAAATKALEIDDSLAEAHTSLAFAYMYYDWNWEGAERELRRAIELNRDYALARFWYASYLFLNGRLNEGYTELKRAQELDPLSPMINWGMGAYFVITGQYDMAIEISNKILSIEANIIMAHVTLSWAYFEKKMYDEAFTAEINILRLFGESKEVIDALQNIYSKSGYEEAVNRMYEMTTTKYAGPINMARKCARFGEIDEAFNWLEKALDEREAGAAMLKLDPAFANMRSHPRFADLLSRIGLTK